MRSRCRPKPKGSYLTAHLSPLLVSCLIMVLVWAGSALCMSNTELKNLRQDTEHMFYHGYNNYMEHAFPEDELRPISCKPLTRDRANPAHIELNDPLGNYSLTLIDSLSTLAILASSCGSKTGGKHALQKFQEGIVSLVEQYGDGTNGQHGIGVRARGFDLDSKVQVFETVIRGVGGLLSAHLFATGDLPITGYDPKSSAEIDDFGDTPVKWSEDFTYDGQLLRLAHDLAERLLPAFSTSTGIPYPRVNLRYGVPFYKNSPLCEDSEHGQCLVDDQGQCLAPPSSPRELTETCSAGAGSLVLEFTVLSRLTGDTRFETLAKRAFWSIWERRSSIDLVGSGIDAESGLWTSPYTGLGAGIDSFFEYAVKSYILLSGSVPPDTSRLGLDDRPEYNFAPPLSPEQHDPESFLQVWQQAHAALKRHLYRGETYIHPHYIQADLNTGAVRAFWMDSLSAFFPGLLSMIGDIEEAVETHLLFTALWTRYSAIPERWSAATGSIEGGLGWWGGRPEFIESTYHIFRATQDPWYLHVGEMALRDIKRRCWTHCGWSGVQDVRNGERSDRMESFFLGETTKYLYLLFDPDHPLNKLDGPFVFTTEGHPLIIPQSARSTKHPAVKKAMSEALDVGMSTCPAPKPQLPFSISATANRPDIFHAANLARLHLMPTIENLDSPLIEYSSDHPSISLSDIRSPTNYTYYPWTLPLELIPHNGTCSVMIPRPTFDITFPPTPSSIFSSGLMQRVGNGIIINSMAGLRLGMIQDVPLVKGGNGDGDLFRVQAINNMPLGKDEKVFLSKEVASIAVSAADPNFARIRDPTMLEVVVDVEPSIKELKVPAKEDNRTTQDIANSLPEIMAVDGDSDAASTMRLALSFIAQQVTSMIRDQPTTPKKSLPREHIPGITPTGPGAAAIPDVQEASGPDAAGAPQGSLLWNSIYVAEHNCDAKLPAELPRNHQIIVMKRGGCSFSRKLQNIPSFTPSSTSLQLVIVVSFEESENGHPDRWPVRPLLDSPQFTASGLPRHNPIPMVMVGGGERVYDILGRAVALGIKRRYTVQAQGVTISNVIIV